MTTLREKRAAYARHLVETEQFDKAISLYNRMVADDPTDVDTLQKLAGLHLRRGEFAKALSANERIAEHHFRSGNHFDAATVYELIWAVLARNAPELRAGYSLVPQRLAEIHAASADRDGSLRALDRLLRIQHDNMLARVAARMCLDRGDSAGAASALAHLRKCFHSEKVDVAAASLAVEAFDRLGHAQKGTLLLKESARIAWRTGQDAIYNALVDVLAVRDYDDTVVDLAERRERIRGDITVVDPQPEAPSYISARAVRDSDVDVPSNASRVSRDSMLDGRTHVDTERPHEDSIMSGRTIVNRREDSVTNVDVPVFDESFSEYSVSQEISADDLEVISSDLISSDIISADDYSRVEVVSESGHTTQPFHRETIPDAPVVPPAPQSDTGEPIPLQRRLDRVDLPPLEWDDEEITPTEIDSGNR